MKIQRKFFSTANLIAVSACLAGLPLLQAQAAPLVFNTGGEIGVGASHRITGDMPNSPSYSDIVSYENGTLVRSSATDSNQQPYNRSRYNAAYGGDLRADANADNADQGRNRDPNRPMNTRYSNSEDNSYNDTSKSGNSAYSDADNPAKKKKLRHHRRHHPSKNNNQENNNSNE
jgi:hypothetical protein